MPTSLPYPVRNPKFERGALRARGRSLAWGARTYVAGIVNVTPDSFSGDGVDDPDGAVAHALGQLAAGADILDIGGESTRPGHVPVDGATELRRILPVIAGVRERCPEALISVDTYKAEVAAAALEAGADILNSVWGWTRGMLEVAASHGAPAILMHNKRVAVYEGDVVDEVVEWLERQAHEAVDAGVPAESIMLDPGIGFGKTQEHNIALLRGLPRVVALGFPTLLGTSRKSTIGFLTGKPAGPQRAWGTAATVALAVAAGIDVVRVHDVAEMVDVVRVSDAIEHGWRPEDWRDRLR
ncbi:dihydropteroate synthase [bacterium]|nr:MAG: dihydropteroate synthase [bacterium]